MQPGKRRVPCAAREIPAVLYGHLVETTPITLNAVEVLPQLATLTSSSTVTINLDGKDYPARVRRKT